VLWHQRQKNIVKRRPKLGLSVKNAALGPPLFSVARFCDKCATIAFCGTFSGQDGYCSRIVVSRDMMPLSRPFWPIWRRSACFLVLLWLSFWEQHYCAYIFVGRMRYQFFQVPPWFLSMFLGARQKAREICHHEELLQVRLSHVLGKHAFPSRVTPTTAPLSSFDF